MKINENFEYKYIEFTKNYVLYRFHNWYEKALTEGLVLPDHITKLYQLSSKAGFIEPIESELELYLS